MAEKKKTYVEDMDRGIYDIKNEDEFSYKTERGLTREIVEQISNEKNDPQWMREFRLKALETYNRIDMPTWGPDLSELNMDDIVAYVRPKGKLAETWEDSRSREKISCRCWGTI